MGYSPWNHKESDSLSDFTFFNKPLGVPLFSIYM